MRELVFGSRYSAHDQVLGVVLAAVGARLLAGQRYALQARVDVLLLVFDAFWRNPWVSK